MRTAELLSSHECFIEPLLNVQSVSEANALPEGVDGCDGIVATSANAFLNIVRADLPESLQNAPVFVTGDRTARAARSAGWTDIHSAKGNAQDLADLLKKTYSATTMVTLLYPRARQISFDMGKALSETYIRLLEWTVYQTVASTKLSDPVISALNRGEIDGVLLYSPRTARTFASLFSKSVENGQKLPTFFCLSHAIAASLPHEWMEHCLYPEKPEEKTLIELIDTVSSPSRNRPV